MKIGDKVLGPEGKLLRIHRFDISAIEHGRPQFTAECDLLDGGDGTFDVGVLEPAPEEVVLRLEGEARAARAAREATPAPPVEEPKAVAADHDEPRMGDVL
jgi:hypothetical protein